MPSHLKILYHDDVLVAIDKPAGLLVHRSRIDTRAREFAVQRVRDQIGQTVYPIHRLDRPTSGVLLFALNPSIARSLCQQFEARTVDKRYEAIVRGHPPASGRWSEPLHERHDPLTDSRAAVGKDAQAAVTEFETLQTWTVPYSAGKYPCSRYALVRIVPKSGRRHQIRRHFNHLAHPVIGDTSHGDRRHNRLFRDVFGIRRLLLVARSLTFDHPVSGMKLTVTAARGPEFDSAMAQLDSRNGETTDGHQLSS